MVQGISRLHINHLPMNILRYVEIYYGPLTFGVPFAIKRWSDQCFLNLFYPILLTFEIIGYLVVINILSPVDVPESLNERKLRCPMKCQNLEEETSHIRCDKKDVIAVISQIE